MTHEVLRIHAIDNVGVATAELRMGTRVLVDGKRFTLRHDVPFGHKIALAPIRSGEPIVKYGEVVGRATRSIAPGEHVSIHNVESLRFRGTGSSNCSLLSDDPVERAFGTSEPLHFTVSGLRGYRRADGRVGIRNHVVVMSTVACANVVVDRICREVQGTVPITHSCGCPQSGEDLAQTVRVLEGHARHPNVGAVLLVGLGCESVPTREIAVSLRQQGFRSEVLIIQDEGGAVATIEKGAKIAADFREQVSGLKREEMLPEELIVGTECGGSDAWSGITANPLAGAVADLVIAAGGTVFLPEVTEFVGAEHLLARRAASASVRNALLQAVRRREEDASRQGVDLRGGQPTPGNIAGGISTIEEKSMGAIAKGGTAAIREVVGYGNVPTCRGLVVMDTPGSDIHSVTALVAGGAHIVLFTTGRGTPTGSPLAPVIKIASNSTLFDKMRADIDFDAGRILDGIPLPVLATDLLHLVVEVASGAQTAAERLGARDFAIETLGLRL